MIPATSLPVAPDSVVAVAAVVAAVALPTSVQAMMAQRKTAASSELCPGSRVLTAFTSAQTSIDFQYRMSPFPISRAQRARSVGSSMPISPPNPAGLPLTPGGDWRVSQLQFNAATGTVVASVRRGTSSTAKIYVRATDCETYDEIVSPIAGQLFRTVAVCEVAPFALYAVPEGAGGGLALFVSGLPHGSMSRIPSPWLVGYHEIWIAELYGVSFDCSRALVGIGTRPQPDPDGGYEVSYLLGHVTVATGEVSVATRLPARHA
jgi:hypothetical protein